MPTDRPESWRVGEVVSTRKLNQMVDAIIQLMTVVGWDTSRLREDPRNPIPFAIRVGKVVSNGPSSAPDWTDERYWVKEHAIIAGDSAFAPIILQPKPDIVLKNPTGGADVTIPPVFTVTNIGELATHGHSLPVDTIVPFVGLFDASQPVPNTRYIMIVGGGAETAPEFQGDVHVGVANGVAAWAPPSVTNYTP